MSDLISRQAAITAIQKAYADTEGGTDKCAVWKNVGLTNALHIMQDLPSARSASYRQVTGKLDCISRQAAIDAIGNVPDHDDGMVWEALSHAQRDVALLPSTQPDVVTASLEELINDYGEDGFFIVDGVNYQANELLNELKINSSVGEKFRKQIAQTIVQYFMKFGG